MELFNPEKCMLMRAKDVQKKLDDRTRIPAVIRW